MGRSVPGVDIGPVARRTGAVMRGVSPQACDGASREELEALAEIAMAHLAPYMSRAG
ncbi:hypothetical protein [Streptomyces chromofuscus]|uniref:TetR family transcriptional regulator n=1 Tax=Streptomyces chromofuscus TaxID=42881 RepID=A0A7M2T2T6_STRCW|nr:hypothetical protein [Streptomyces chromofuscus]QOV42872.1 hypothetical protein IPT68_24175 [Streptomyces chromofuscus]GGS91604.1 hypothetical protein GCM10010254_09420 [Streptomyces chromofuscus]